MKLYIAERKIRSFETYKKKGFGQGKGDYRQSWMDNWEIKYQKK